MSWIKVLWEESHVLSEKRSKQYQFLGLLLVLSVLIAYRFFGWNSDSYIIVGVVLSLVTIGGFFPWLISPLLIIWFFIGKVVGELMSWMLLSVLYFAFIWMTKLFVKPSSKGGWVEVKGKEKDYSNMG